jgi:hypothetical protein
MQAIICCKKILYCTSKDSSSIRYLPAYCAQPSCRNDLLRYDDLEALSRHLRDTHKYTENDQYQTNSNGEDTNSNLIQEQLTSPTIACNNDYNNKDCSSYLPASGPQEVQFDIDQIYNKIKEKTFLDVLKLKANNRLSDVVLNEMIKTLSDTYNMIFSTIFDNLKTLAQHWNDNDHAIQLDKFIDTFSVFSEQNGFEWCFKF